MSDKRAVIESAVTAIWQSVLEAPNASAKDNFLDLGGNSLKAGEVAWRVREELGVDITLDVVLDTETLGDLVDTLASLSESASERVPQ